MSADNDVSRLRRIWIDPRENPAQAVVEDEARRAVVAYPKIAVSAPGYGAARHLGGDRWRIVLSDEAFPQSARDDLTAYFRRLARDADDPALRREFEAAYTQLEWEKINEVSAGDHRVRVIRVERFIRKGSDGPEPPRPTDPDRLDQREGRTDRVTGFVIDPAAATGWGDASLRMQLLASSYPPGIPEEVRADSLRALDGYPGGVLLPVIFTRGELVDGGWQHAAGYYSSPHEARAGLAFSLRFDAANWRELGKPDPGERLRQRWLALADRIDSGPSNEIELLDRVVRIVRVEQLVRVGPEGPEPPRPSDPDPDVPVEVWAQQNPREDVED